MAVIYQSINDSNRIRMLYWNDQGSPINPENRSGKDSNEISWDGREVASRALGHVRIVIERITVDARAYVRKSCWHLDTRFLSLFSLWCASPSYPTENSIVKYFTGEASLRNRSYILLKDPRPGILFTNRSFSHIYSPHGSTRFSIGN